MTKPNLNQSTKTLSNILSKKQKLFYIFLGILIAFLCASFFYFGVDFWSGAFLKHFIGQLVWNISLKFTWKTGGIEDTVSMIIWILIVSTYLILTIFFRKKAKHSQKYKYILRGFVWVVPVLGLVYLMIYIWYIIMFARFLDSAFGNQ